MAQRKKTETDVDEAAKKVAQLDEQEAAPSSLDDPDAPNQPSHTRHWVYAGLVIFGGLAVNVLLIALLGASAGG